jgi:hypothetical protein
MAIPARVVSRIGEKLKNYQGILAQAVKKDSSEADTANIVRDMIADILGYDKYQDLNAEHAIRGTYVDLLVSADSKPRFLVEIKAVGSELKDSYIKQVVDYAANKGLIGSSSQTRCDGRYTRFCSQSRSTRYWSVILTLSKLTAKARKRRSALAI